MRDDDERPARRLSMRDVAAAWIACGLIALGADLADTLADSGTAPDAARVDAAMVAAAGVRLPGRIGWNAPERHPGRDLDDPADESSTDYAAGEAPAFCTPLDIVEAAPPPTRTPPTQTPPTAPSRIASSPVTSAPSRC